jgi:hypothetical protein
MPLASLDRRVFACGALVTAISGMLFADDEPVYAQAGDEVSFRWRVPTAHYETVKSSLIFKGTVEEEHDTKGLPLIFIFIGVTLLPSLIDAIITLRRKLVEPGLKIDTRDKEVKIDVDSDLPRGSILLIDKKGAKLIEPDQLTVPSELTKVLADAMAK